MTALTVLRAEILKDISCGTGLLDLEIRAAAEEFLTRSTCWRVTLTPQDWKATTITGITNGSPTLIAAAAHGFATGDQVLLANMPSLQQLQGFLWPVTVVDANSFTIAVDSTAFDVFAGTALATVPVYSMPASSFAYARVCEVLGADTNSTTSPGSLPIFGRPEMTGPDIAITSPDRLDAEWPGWKREVGAPKWVVGLDESTVRFVPAPQAAAPLAWSLIVALTLNDDATQIPDNIYLRWKYHIASGARARLHLEPNKPWTNDKLYAEHQERFNAGIYKAGNRARKGFTKTPTIANAVSYGGLS